MAKLPDDEQPRFRKGLFKKLRMSDMCRDVGLDMMLDVHQQLLDSARREAREVE